MKDIKLYFSESELKNYENGGYMFGYEFKSLQQAHTEFEESYSDITLMRKFSHKKLTLYSFNGDVFIYIVKDY